MPSFKSLFLLAVAAATPIIAGPLDASLNSNKREESPDAAERVKCGRTLCAAGLVCCNASCGICTAPGGMCTMQACMDADDTNPSAIPTTIITVTGKPVPTLPPVPTVAPPSGKKCGKKMCKPGFECCNSSCGICAPKGGACIQIYCANGTLPWGSRPTDPVTGVEYGSDGVLE